MRFQRQTLWVLVGLLALVTASCDWPMFQYGPSRTGFYLFETKLTTANVGQLHEVWSADLGTGTIAEHAVGCRGR